MEFFETTIRPLFSKHCYECHSRKAKVPQGGLRLDTREGLYQGGKSGPAIVPGDPGASLLIDAVKHVSLKMPPRTRLSAAEVANLVQWVTMGAPFPVEQYLGNTIRDDEERQVTPGDREYWPYRDLQRPQVPVLPAPLLASHPIDAFIRNRLEAEQLQPNRTATRRELIRRAYFDLIGLPPTPGQVDRFVGDTSPRAWETVLEDLLSRPQYGERWGRHWLDIVRFAQTNGYERDEEKPLAWRYRDYVIKAFNEDKPYDRFIMEQLAGDELDEISDDSLTATAFYRLGVWDDEPDDLRAAEYDALDDVLSTMGQVFLGQTIGCARCHDHMFDPISQEDYYGLLAFVRNIKHYVKPTSNTAESTLFFNLPSGLGRTLAVRETGRIPLPTHLLIRGDAGSPSREILPHFPEVLSDYSKRANVLIRNAPEGRDSTGRRRALAEWIANPAHPLTSRVMVNRVWQHHFGRAIVATPNDFGHAGIPPTHPELLDWLAVEFVDSGWSIKKLQRAIMTSATYRTSPRTDNIPPDQRDPGNKLFWRQNLRRLDAEAIRDSVLAVSGQLNDTMGGRGIFPRLSSEVVAGQSKPGFGWDVSSDDDRRRRSIYIFAKRGLRDPLMEAFDYVNTTTPLGVRPTTTVAPQALIMLNSRFVQESAATFGQQIQADVGNKPTAQIRQLYRVALGRYPKDTELSIARRYLDNARRQARDVLDHITFRPNVPESLFSGYREKLTPDEHLLGSHPGWSYHAGVWGSGYEGIEAVDIQQAPFALWQGPGFTDGRLSGLLRLHRGSELAAILIRALPDRNSWTGYGIYLDPRNQTVVLTRRNDGAEILATAVAAVPVDDWQTFELEAQGSQVRFWLGDSGQPLIDVHDPNPVERGLVGFSTWGAALSLDKLIMTSDDNQWNVAECAMVPLADTEVFAGWQHVAGDWIQSADGAWTIGSGRNASVIWDNQKFRKAEVSVALRFAPQRAFKAGLLLNLRDAAPGESGWSGYEVGFDAGRQTVFLADHRAHWLPLAEAAVKIEPGRWMDLRVILQSTRVQVFVDRSRDPLIDYAVPQPLSGGYVGLQTRESEVAFRQLAVTVGNTTKAADFRPPRGAISSLPDNEERARQRALQSLCKLIFNLNEFVYID